MSYSPKSQKTYRKKSIQFSCNYRPNEIQEGQRLKNYLSETKQSANSYIKALIKADLDSKNIPYPQSIFIY
jgi:hypothetical protein